MKKINPLFPNQPLFVITFFFLLSTFFLFEDQLLAQNGQIVLTDLSQQNFLKAYKSVFDLSDKDYHGTSTTMDKVMFPQYGEFSVYWILSGTDQGNFVVPDTLPSRDLSVTCKPYLNSYNWKNAEHRSIQFKNTAKKVAVFRSKIETDGYSISWEAQYFKNLFETFLYKNSYYFVNEDDLTKGNLSDSTKLLIIPAFTVHKNGDAYYMDSIFTIAPQIKNNLHNFLSRGGMVYTEGNAAYFIQKAGYLDAGAVNFNDKANSKSNLLDLTSFSTSNPIAFAHTGVKDQLYGTSVPKVTAATANIIASLKSDNRPIIFELSGSKADGGRIICNLGIPTVGGVSEVENGSRQLQWAFNTLLYAFSERLDVTRSVFNVLPPAVVAGDNAVSYDRIDTFEVRIRLRNLSTETVSGISLNENFRNYFTLFDVVSSVGSSSYSNGVLTLSGISLPPQSEQMIVYRLTTPSPEANVHEQVDKLIDYGTFVASSLNKTGYSDSQGNHTFTKQRDYADIMFSARLFGDADINWKNFLGLGWQPFKVFMNMENKERTQAENTVYTQFIPKDMPFYRSDGKLNIPIVKTPGGTFIDVLKGSDDKDAPEFDMDGNGYPDVWLDTASIYPKGYKIETVEVYWANPWKTLEAKQKGLNKIVYEDINHNGTVTTDDNGDGIYETEDPGDKIRAWKITWPIGTVKGNDYFDPYCSMEVWVDAPDMVAMAQGVSYAFGRTDKKEGFYPYKTLDAAKASHSTTDSWINWMDKNTDGTVQWSKMYKQKMYNYQGYAFMDSTTYQQKPWDTYYATVPHPHEEFVAVLSMGGEEIDMYHPTPAQSLYSKIDYKTIFNEQRVTPIRTTYSFYAPLPNPLQFEYLASNYSISDTLNNPLTVLPAKGKAKLKFDLDASTEYSYYWIRNVGHKVERTAPWIKDTVKNLGSGVFGYMIYEIPKGMGGYKITLPKKADGTYDTDAIVQVDGKNFATWLTNPNTGNAIEIWEDPFSYQVYIPQLLIPPALCDKNGDGVDDWIDDLGDRYHSETGYLNDAFMPGNGESYPAGSPNVFTHVDDGITVTQGWSAGADKTYGSDKFDELGRAHFTINALYEGKGKEGPVDISKGGTLVVEEIFGGSPWVIFSHVLTANAEGVDYKITSSASPTSVKYGMDTVFIKHTIEDANEPHEFNGNYDPYRASFGSSKATATSMAGGKDPCDWVTPNYATTTLIDPKKDHKTDITLIAGASKSSSLTKAGYPKKVSGTFLQVKVEVLNDDIENGTSYEWLNTTIKPDLSKAGASKVVLSYVSYPRPLVPGDQPATDTTGWRFNQPEGEVLIVLGDTMKSRLQATRRAYFVFLISIDETLKKGIYPIGFTLSGERKNYKGVSGGNLSLSVAPVKFSIVEKGDDNRPAEFQKFRIGEGSLTSLTLQGTEYFEGLNQVRWSTQDVDYTNFKNIATSVPASYSKETGVEVIDLSKIGRLPNADSAQLYLLEKVAVNSYRAGEDIDLTTGENLAYTYNNKPYAVSGNNVSVSPYGPRILIKQELYSVNGVPIADSLYLKSDDSKLYIVTKLEAINAGSDLSAQTIISIHPGPFYNVLKDSLPSNVTFANGLISANLGALQPGETKFAYVYYTVDQSISSIDDFMTVIKLSDIEYVGPTKVKFKYVDPQKVLFDMYDFQLSNIQDTKIADREFSISATAINRGLPATNVWFRIYPVIGGGISEFPIGEMKIDNFATGQSVVLTVPDYKAPNGEKIEVVAKIDDGNKIKEILEQNNAQVLQLAGPLGVNDLKKDFGVNVYPNPFAKFVQFAYDLQTDAKDVKITIYSQNGSEIVNFINCPSAAGSHIIGWSPQVINGNYIYRFTITRKDGTVSEIPGILIKTDE